MHMSLIRIQLFLEVREIFSCSLCSLQAFFVALSVPRSGYIVNVIVSCKYYISSFQLIENAVISQERIGWHAL